MDNTEHDVVGTTEAAGIAELRDEEISQVSGGSIGTGYTVPIEREDYVEWRVKCLACGADYTKRGSGMDYMLGTANATCDQCGSSNLDQGFMRILVKGYFA